MGRHLGDGGMALRNFTDDLILRKIKTDCFNVLSGKPLCSIPADVWGVQPVTFACIIPFAVPAGLQDQNVIRLQAPTGTPEVSAVDFLIGSYRAEVSDQCCAAQPIKFHLVHECRDGYVVALCGGRLTTAILPWLLESGVIDHTWLAREDWKSYDYRVFRGGDFAIPYDELVETLAAGAVPNAVDAEIMDRMKAHWSERQIVQILGAVCLYGFLNRWNDSMATDLEAAPRAMGERVLARDEVGVDALEQRRSVHLGDPDQADAITQLVGCKNPGGRMGQQNLGGRYSQHGRWNQYQSPNLPYSKGVGSPVAALPIWWAS